MVAKKRKIRKSRWHNFFSVLPIFFIFLFLGFLIVSNIRISQRRSEMLSEIKELEKEIQTLEERNSNLRAGISEADEEAYWEEGVRERGFVKEGENPVVVLPSGKTEIEQEQNADQGFFNRLLEKIKNILRE